MSLKQKHHVIFVIDSIDWLELASTLHKTDNEKHWKLYKISQNMYFT